MIVSHLTPAEPDEALGCNAPGKALSVTELLEKAQELIEKNGWTQRNFEQTTGEVCAIGAMNKALRTLRPYSWQVQDYAMKKAGNYLKEAIEITCPVDYPWITYWNDTPGRTKEEVIEIFRIATKLASEGDVESL